MATTMQGLRLRRSFRKIDEEHYALRQRGYKGPTELENLVLAWKGIQELPPGDLNSFFLIGGYHGEPFRGAGWSNPMWWGGYCSHGQILFPTWHRAYLKRLEDALRSIPGCADVSLPFLDWCDDETGKSGLPDTLNSPNFTLGDGTVIKNSLYSFKFPKGCFNQLPQVWNGDAQADYTKLRGYETVRFPYSGLMGTPEDQEASAKWNKQFSTEQAASALNHNVQDWLGAGFDQKQPNGTVKHINTGTREKFRKCLDAPNYTVFSNTSSASQYNSEQLNRERTSFGDKDVVVVPLESPHNDMHLAVGGFNFGGPHSDRNPTDYSKANGDMGENDTAGLDPIFYLHHCFIDRMFWLWQLKHNQVNELTISPEFAQYPGSNNFDGQGPTAGQGAGDFLTLKSPLDPFVNFDGSKVCSLDVINVEFQLGYTYGPGSFTNHEGRLLHQYDLLASIPQSQEVSTPLTVQSAVEVKGIKRGNISGSFVIALEKDGKVVAAESVLSRWNTAGCANCQTHASVTAHIPLPGVTDHKTFNEGNFNVKVYTRGSQDNFDLKDSKPTNNLPRFSFKAAPKAN